MKRDSLKLFVCEFITGGGLSRVPLPASLAKEGSAMRDALLRDLFQIPDITIFITHDARLPAPNVSKSKISLLSVDAETDVWKTWDDCIASCDAAWIIAPETNGMLLCLTEMVERHHKVLLGCGSNSVKLCASKYASYQLLKTLPHPTPATYRWVDWQALNMNNQEGTWVCKQDDGVGAEDSAYFEDISLLHTFIQTRQHSHVIQPFIHGKTASISMLCKQGNAWLLSANLQKTECIAANEKQNAHFVYTGSIVNGMVEYWVAFEKIAQDIAEALPDLSGYVGIDVIVSDEAIWLLEINPRLTSSYTALTEATGRNPAQLVIDLICGNPFEVQSIMQHRVESFL